MNRIKSPHYHSVFVFFFLLLSSCKENVGLVESSSIIIEPSNVATCIDMNGELPFAGGSGSAEDPYLVCDSSGFNSIGENYLTANFKLTQNIDFGGSALTPIGTDLLAFTGVFDGGNFEISNFVLESSQERIGLFRTLGSTGQVQNLFVRNATVSGTARVGSIAGYSAGKLEKVVVRGSSVLGSGDYVGGLVGLMEGNTTALLQKTYFEGEVDGANDVGGLVGRVNMGSVRQSVSEANVQAVSSRAGGMVGSYADNSCGGSFPSATADFADNLSLATVSGDSYVGGIFGLANMVPCSYRIISAATVSATGNYVGGFAGSSNKGALDTIIAVASVSASGTYRGGFAGLFSPMMYNRLYVDFNRSGMPFARGGNTSANGSDSGVTKVNIDGSTPDYFKDLTNAPYSQFDFINTWEQVDAASFPTLIWLESALAERQ